MTDQRQELRDRTKQFAIRIVRLFRSLPKIAEAQIIGKQLLRSATGIAANYRAACRARSRAEWVAKMGVVVEEADETLLWLELLVEAAIVTEERMQLLLLEANELLAIFSSSRRTARNK